MRNTFNSIKLTTIDIIKLMLAILMIFGGIVWASYIFSSVPYYYFIIAILGLFLAIAIVLYRHNKLINIELEKKRKEQEEKEKVRYIIIK
ncbi:MULTISPECIES: hypothetical protein [Pasteurellaceae]|uniref:Hemophilus-specific protein n=1 Tax=Pasteurella atlantica TaxID=2827233 RepID=A0AAW8CGZ3_9PAST|nr:hypothetical protein [Pasteurella atlantica]MBR0573856.1 hypothetical protein [Pasteurella atlantica]MDP8039248.1 hypothetical protein [Pasteurella atlantica]MDP8041339.1 hypothetical protein [Pasteurella atlantica]MDP8043475.1 hypothetical protein [Pasteurella atlantica]MDP8045606.1 hypothetical protein [Pasteurella atlantica]